LLLLLPLLLQVGDEVFRCGCVQAVVVHGGVAQHPQHTAWADLASKQVERNVAVWLYRLVFEAPACPGHCRVQCRMKWLRGARNWHG
ncbi:hypothetical protein V8C86DRAFT_2454678, partial [Haematococcus lacustris]